MHYCGSVDGHTHGTQVPRARVDGGDRGDLAVEMGLVPSTHLRTGLPRAMGCLFLTNRSLACGSQRMLRPRMLRHRLHVLRWVAPVFERLFLR